MADFDCIFVSTGVSLKSYVIMIDPATFCGSGEIPVAIITLNAANGQFITQANSGATPILAQFDNIQLLFTDDAGLIHHKIYMVDKVVPKENAQEGDRLEVHCIGRERWLQVIDFAKQYYFDSGFNVVKDLADKYNANKTSNQITVVNQDSTTYNQLPQWTANNYDFNVTEKSVYDGMMEVIDKLGTSVSGGGAGDFFELRFDDDAADITNTQMILNAFSSGITDTGVIISQSLSVNTSDTEGGIESQAGTLIKCWGATDQGSLPVDFSQFHGIDEAFRLYPVWQSVTGGYPQNAIVQYDSGSGLKVYSSDTDGNTSTPPTNWTEIHEYTLLGSLNYSPWTNGSAMASAWICSGAGNKVGAWATAMWDSNLVISDGTYYRTFADTRSNTTAISTNYKMDNGAGGFNFYRGFRILVDTTLGAVGGDFALNSGKDRFGNNYAKSVVIHNGGTNTGSDAYKNWDCIVALSPPATALNTVSLANNYQCAVIDEAKVYAYSTGGGAWADISGNSKANDCFHPRGTLTNDTGTGLNVATSGGGTYGDNSAIKITYTFDPASVIAGILFTSTSYYQCGCWLNIMFPFPPNKLTGSTAVGSKYGGYQKSYPEPATIDSLNMHMTHTGNTGFNFSDSIDLGALSAIAFQTKLLFSDALSRQIAVGNFKMRCAIYDTNNNIVTQDFVIQFNNTWQDVILPLQGFQTYRARVPFGPGDFAQFVPVPGLSVVNVFQWKNIKSICIQLQDVYDDEGRYKPEGSNVLKTALAATAIGNSTISLWIDSFRFVKPLLATSGVVTDYTIEPISIQRQNISNYQQLLNDALSMKQVYQFQHKDFDISTTLACDVQFGETFYYRNASLVNASDNGSNTIKLVAKKVSYYVNKKDGPGGLTRSIYGVKRLSS